MASVSAIASAASVAASTLSQLMTDVSFSTTVSGKNYSGNVQYSSGEYIGNDPHLSGAEATGPSVQQAEDNTISRIDFFA